MGKSRVVGFVPERFKQEIMKEYIEKQTNDFIEYAQNKVRQIGRRIMQYATGNHMQDTGNLLDSLCWGVSYSGQLAAGGFFREKSATEPSYLHGKSMVTVLEGNVKKKWVYPWENDGRMEVWSETDAGEEVNGHELAAEFLLKKGSESKQGQWVVFFAILAPYWGYWEKGFNYVSGSAQRGNRMLTFKQFAVMAETCDQIKGELKPARTYLSVSVNKYAAKSLYRQAKRNLKQNAR